MTSPEKCCPGCGVTAIYVESLRCYSCRVDLVELDPQRPAIRRDRSGAWSWRLASSRSWQGCEGEHQAREIVASYTSTPPTVIRGKVDPPQPLAHPGSRYWTAWDGFCPHSGGHGPR